MLSVFYSDVITIAPTTMKKFISAHGFAEKEDLAKIIEPKYDLVGKNLAPDEIDAIGLSEVAAYAQMIMDGKEDIVAKILTPEQFKAFRNREFVYKSRKIKGVKKRKKVATTKMMGICDRVDDLYIKKRSQ